MTRLTAETPAARSIPRKLRTKMSEQGEMATTNSGAAWLTTDGLSKMLGGVPVSTIRGWRLAGIGPPHVRFGGLVRYERAAVDRWIAAGGDRKGAAQR